MPLGAFHQEIATLLADAVIREARRIGERTSDRKERAKLDAEYRKMERSTDWFSQLIVERAKQNDQEEKERRQSDRKAARP